MHKQQTKLSSIKIMNGTISALLRYKQALDTYAVSSLFFLAKENFIIQYNDYITKENDGCTTKSKGFQRAF